MFQFFSKSFLNCLITRLRILYLNSHSKVRIFLAKVIRLVAYCERILWLYLPKLLPNYYTLFVIQIETLVEVAEYIAGNVEISKCAINSWKYMIAYILCNGILKIELNEKIKPAILTKVCSNLLFWVSIR